MRKFYCKCLFSEKVIVMRGDLTLWALFLTLRSTPKISMQLIKFMNLEKHLTKYVKLLREIWRFSAIFKRKQIFFFCINSA